MANKAVGNFGCYSPGLVRAESCRILCMFASIHRNILVSQELRIRVRVVHLPIWYTIVIL